MGVRELTLGEWVAEGTARFGIDRCQWKFVCPACGHVQTVEDFRKYKDVGAGPDSAYFNCIGRYGGPAREAFALDGEGPCNYTTGGLFNISPVKIIDHRGNEHHAFDFAGPSLA